VRVTNPVTMMRPSRFRGLRFVAGFSLGAALLLCRPAPRLTRPEPALPVTIDGDLRQLAAPDGKVKYLYSVNPGGPVFEFSPSMERLVERGREIQPQLLDALRDPARRNEAALILARVGDKDVLPYLIDLLPANAEPSEDDRFSARCLLYALWRLTGIDLGINGKFSPDYSPEFRAAWQAWHEANRAFLYTPPEPTRAGSHLDRHRVLVDLEAKIAGTPSAAYRREHPWIGLAEVKDWRDDRAYERGLRDFCLSVLINPTSSAYGDPSREAIRALGAVPDPRALAALHTLCAAAPDTGAAFDLITALEERGDASSLPVIERIPRPKDAQPGRDAGERRRASAVERLRLLTKYGRELAGKPFDAEQQTNFMRCLEGVPGVQALVANLRNRGYDCFLPKYALVAGYVDRPPVRACLKEIAADTTRDERARIRAHGALARLGEAVSLGHLRQSLAHPDPGVRLAAADGLWRLGDRQGIPALVGLLDLRPIETGGEGVRVRDGSFTVTAIRGGNVEVVRDACSILGEAGDRSAVEPLRRLLELNLNGVLAGGGSGTGWAGRSDAVALARLGDFSGISILRASIARGDPLGVVEAWGGGDFAAIGRRRFIPELLPLLGNRDEDKRVQAARDILLLLERGR